MNTYGYDETIGYFNPYAFAELPNTFDTLLNVFIRTVGPEYKVWMSISETLIMFGVSRIGYAFHTSQVIDQNHIRYASYEAVAINEALQVQRTWNKYKEERCTSLNSAETAGE